MLIGITIDKYKGINPSVLIKLVRKIGLNFIEITESVFKDLSNVISEIGNIKTGFHLPNYGDYGYDFSFVENSEEINRLIDLINEHQDSLNIQYCLSHPPECDQSTLNKEKSISFLYENLNKLEPPIIIENIISLSHKDFSDFYLQTKKILGDKVIGQCYDAPHYFTSGEDPVSLLDNLDGDINSIIKAMHLSDCTRKKDAHLPFGLGGELPLDKILQSLKNQNYKGIINLELLPRSVSDLKAVVDSYLKVLKNFERGRFFRTKIKLGFYIPILQSMLKK